MHLIMMQTLIHDKKIIEQDGFFLILTEVVLLVGLYLGGISIMLSIILILLYCLYIVLVFKKRNKKIVLFLNILKKSFCQKCHIYS